MRLKRFLLSGIFFGFIGLSLWILTGQQAIEAKEELHPRPEIDLTAGLEAYTANCARCHGDTGAGDGWDAEKMLPRPRKISEGIFKFRSTASGTPPTDEDLLKTITYGLSGSRMPDFQRLSEETRWQLVEYVKHLSGDIFEETPELIAMGSDPGPEAFDAAKGKAVYALLQCAACHGDQGRANGPSAPTLVDNWENPIRAANLTQGWTYRSGNTPQDILTRLLAGIDGTPMPSYDGAVPVEDAWQLAYYVHSLQEQKNFGQRITARKTGTLPATAADPAWAAAPETTLLLSASNYQDHQIQPVTVTAISVQALYNETAWVLRLVWNDPIKAQGAVPDALRIVRLKDRKTKWNIGSLRNLPAPPTDDPSLSTADWNSSQAASAVYEDGLWSVLIRQPAADIDLSEPNLIGIMVWDGDNEETDLHRANSVWVDLVFDEKAKVKSKKAKDKH